MAVNLIRSSLTRKLNSLRFYSTASGGKLEGKVALITGGANGIGKATAHEFIQHGAQVIIADIDAKTGPKAAHELGPKAQFVQCDVAIEAQVAEAVETVVSQHGKLDVMYNNAGISGSSDQRSMTELDLDDFDKVMRINVRGFLAGIKHAARVMIPTGSGSILCTASVWINGWNRAAFIHNIKVYSSWNSEVSCQRAMQNWNKNQLYLADCHTDTNSIELVC